MRLQRIISFAIIPLLVIGGVGVVYVHQVNVTADTLSAESEVAFERANDARVTYYRQKSTEAEAELQAKNQELTAKQAELSQKSSELDQKKAELNKTNNDLTQKLKELKAAQSQLSANASELTQLRNRPPLFDFKVESSNLANVEQKKEDIKQVVTNAYDVIQSVYGSPYLLHSVTIAFVDSFTLPKAAAEIVISNGSDGLALTIKLKDFNKNDFNDVNAIIHEIIHSFHGLALLEPTAYEEGITVAATDAVMEKLIVQGKIPAFDPLYIRIHADDYLSTSLTLPSNDTTFYSAAEIADYYQIAGYGWFQLYKADPNFFKTFNEKIYALKHQGKDITGDSVRSAIEESISVPVQGKSIKEWLGTKAFALG